VAVSWGFSLTQVSAVFGLTGLATAGHLFSSLIPDMFQDSSRDV
jgi:hypothetical protein